MEKIQSAIAKARAARAEGTGLPPAGAARGAAVAVHEPSAPPLPEPHGAAGPRADVAAAWDALPELKVVPRQMERQRILTFGTGREAVAFDVMRTRLLQQMRANNWRSVAITSPGPGCGKTTISLNLAFSLSRQSDIRTILAEIDLRRPSIAKVLGLGGAQNFGRVLEGQAAFADHALRHGTNLAIAPAQSGTRNPAELLHSDRAGAALAAIGADYDPSIMVFDMPPMLGADDTMAFVGRVDCVLLVAAAEMTTIQEVDSCERDLASQTNVLGIVMNKCRYLDRSYGYNYYG